MQFKIDYAKWQTALSLNSKIFSLECPLKSASVYFDFVKYTQRVEEYLH
jgi:hypothetical protein